MKKVETEKAPKAVGPYSQATVAGDFVFCSGQIALDPATGELVAGGVKEQTMQVLKNLEAVLGAAKAKVSQVASVTVYLADMNDFKAMNEVYSEFFGQHKPARATVGVAALPKAALVEISCVAYLQ
jgi:2-iminobutanoate/2-iminopropanoate deaminase